MSVRPLCSSYIAGAWTVEVHQHDRRKQMSSAQVARFGRRSDSSIPLRPCFANSRVLGMMTASPCVSWLFGRPVDSGSGLPAHFASAGLGSNRSIWLGPPTMNRKMTRLAFGSKCDFLGASGFFAAFSSARASRASIPWSAMQASPAAEQEVAARSGAGNVVAHVASVLPRGMSCKDAAACLPGGRHAGRGGTGDRVPWACARRPSRPSLPRSIPRMNRHYDAIVLGVGGMGSAACFELARRGRRVLGLEQFALVHDRGSSHGHTRIIRTAYYEHPGYGPLVRRAFSQWYELEQISGRHLLTECPCLNVGLPGSELVEGVRASVSEHDLTAHELNGDKIGRAFPAFRFPEEYIGILESHAGFLYVEDCV